MSSTNKTSNYQLSQFVGTDIPSILNDYNGDMRKIDTAIHNASVAGGDNATAIAELQTSTARMNTEIGGINSTVNTLSGKVIGIEAVIPATASAQNKLLTAQELPEIPSITELEQDVAELQGTVAEVQSEVSDISGDVKAIQLCVPASASQSNKLLTAEDVEDTVILYRTSYSVQSGVSVSQAIYNMAQFIHDYIASHENINYFIDSIIVNGFYFKFDSSVDAVSSWLEYDSDLHGYNQSGKLVRVRMNPTNSSAEHNYVDTFDFSTGTYARNDDEQISSSIFPSGVLMIKIIKEKVIRDY